MILSEEYLQGLLDLVLEQVEAPPQVTVLLEGSIAEGFGNPSSDIDFLFIEDGAGDLPAMPSILFLDGRRIEVRTRSLRQVCSQLDEVRQAAARGRRHTTRLSEDLLNRCQRLLRGFRLRGEDLTARLEDHLGHGDFAVIMADWWAHYARQSMRQATALAELGRHEDAAGWAQSGLAQATKAWGAEKGETYLEPKWLSMQLERLGEDLVTKRCWSLETFDASGLSAREYVSECADLVAELGVDGCGLTPDRLSVERVPGVTTWQTGERVHVLRAGQDVFALGSQAGRAWRSIVFGRSLHATLSAVRASAAGDGDAGALLALFLRLGFLRLSWRGGGPVTPALPLGSTPGPITPPPSTARPPLTLAGAQVTGDLAVDLVPMPSSRFAATGMTLVWSNVLIENAREDLAGALAKEQWRVAGLALRRVVTSCLRGLLSAYGVHPLPSDSELLRHLWLVPSGVEEMRAAAEALQGAEISSRGQAEWIRSELDTFVERVREATGAWHFPSSFHSAGGWQATLDIGHDWLRMGAYLDADLPIDEARDLLSAGGSQPHLAQSHSDLPIAG